MRLLIFFFISALLHSLLLALPSPYWREGKGEAIPVTLVLDFKETHRTEMQNRNTEKAQSPTETREMSRPKNTKPKITKPQKTENIRPAKKPVVKPIPKTPTIIIARNPSDSPGKKTTASTKPAAKERREPTRMTARKVALTEENIEIAGEMEESLRSLPSEHLPANDLTEEESGIEESNHLLASKPTLTPAATSPPLKKLQGPIDNTEDQGDGPKELLFVRANYARIAKPAYPGRARKMGWEGTTLLRVLVDQQGRSKTVQISQSSGFDSLDRAAVQAVKRWHFHPARSGTRVVESWVKIPIVFSLKDSDRNSLFVNR